MPEVIFILGKTPALSLAEIAAVTGVTPVRENREVASAVLPEGTDLAALQRQLGGTIKIATLVKRLPLGSESAVIAYNLVEYLVNLGQNKLYFALGELGRDHLEPLDVRELKARLEDNGLKVRFSASGRHGAGAALLLHQTRLTEILVINIGQAVLIAHTRTVQDIDDWSRRDRDKPYADHKKGLLPPKLARMMLNLAGPSRQPRALYDPFCGSGTILLEAATLGGFRLYGSDLDVRSVLGTGENLDWWRATYQREVAVHVFARDVTQVKKVDLQGQDIDLIVTEPFLGKQTPRPEQLPGMFRGLEKLYWGAFRGWTRLLAPSARVVIVFPRVVTPGRIYTLDALLDKLSTLGYNKSSQGLIYAREHTVVAREICVFEYERKIGESR